MKHLLFMNIQRKKYYCALGQHRTSLITSFIISCSLLVSLPLRLHAEPPPDPHLFHPVQSQEDKKIHENIAQMLMAYDSADIMRLKSHLTGVALHNIESIGQDIIVDNIHEQTRISGTRELSSLALLISASHRQAWALSGIRYRSGIVNYLMIQLVRVSNVWKVSSIVLADTPKVQSHAEKLTYESFPGYRDISL